MPVPLTSTGIATGVVGEGVAKAGEGVMTMLLDAGVGGSFTGGGPVWLVSVVSVGEVSGEGVPVESGVSVGGGGVSAVVLSDCAPVGCIRNPGAFVGMGSSSSSVEVDVVVRNNALCNTIGPSGGGLPGTGKADASTGDADNPPGDGNTPGDADTPGSNAVAPTVIRQPQTRFRHLKS